MYKNKSGMIKVLCPFKKNYMPRLCSLPKLHSNFLWNLFYIIEKWLLHMYRLLCNRTGICNFGLVVYVKICRFFLYNKKLPLFKNSESFLCQFLFHCWRIHHLYHRISKDQKWVEVMKCKWKNKLFIIFYISYLFKKCIPTARTFKKSSCSI